MADFQIKKGDRLPILTIICKDGDGVPITTLDTATGVLFHMKRHSDDTVVIDSAAASIISTADATVSYAWAAAETDAAGFYQGEFAVQFGSLEETYPNKGYIGIQISEDIA